MWHFGRMSHSPPAAPTGDGGGAGGRAPSAGTPRAGQRRNRDWTAGVPAILLLGGCWLAHVFGTRVADDVAVKERERFTAEAGRWKAFVEGQLGRHVMVVQGLRDWFTLQDEMTERLWTNYFHALNGAVYYPAFRGFGAVESMPQPLPYLIEAHLARMRPRLGTNYTIRATLPGTDPGSSWYGMPLSWFHANLPRDTAQPPFLDYGQDLNQVPDLWAAMNWALGENRPAFGAPFAFSGATGTPPAVPVFLPVYGRDYDPGAEIEPSLVELARARTPAAVKEVYAHARGHGFLRFLVFGLMDFPQLFDRHARGFPPDFALRLSLNDRQGRQHTVYDGPSGRPGHAAYRHTDSLRLGGRDWVIETEAGPGFDSVSRRRTYWMAVCSGWAISLLLSGFVWSQIEARRKQELAAAALEEARDTLQELLEERQRLGRDLHDKTIQSIYSTRLALGLCRERLAGPEPKLAELLSSCELALEQSIAELRGFIRAREPEAETPVALPDALRAVADHLRPLFSGAVRLEVDESLAVRLSPEAAAEMLCIAREATSNSLRHAQAREIRLELRPDGAQALLRLADDGQGFDPQRDGQGQGLHNIAERVAGLGGRLIIQSRPGGGTAVEVRIPLRGKGGA